MVGRTYGRVSCYRSKPDREIVSAPVSYNPVYGERLLKRAIQRELETAIAISILRGIFVRGTPSLWRWRMSD